MTKDNNENGLVDVYEYFSIDLEALEGEQIIDGELVTVPPVFPKGTKVDVARLQADMEKASASGERNIYLPMRDYYIYPDGYDPDATDNLEDDNNASSNLH